MKYRLEMQLVAMTSLLLASCSHSPFNKSKNSSQYPQAVKLVEGISEGSSVDGRGGETSSVSGSDDLYSSNPNGYQVQEIPNLSGNGNISGREDTSYAPPRTKTKLVDTHIKPLEIPLFLDYVFGENLLDIPFVTGPEVSSMKETIQLRTEKQMTGVDFQDLIIESLKDYDLQFLPQKNGYKIVLGNELSTKPPAFITSRANRATPNALQPYLEFVPVNYVEVSDMKAVLDQAFSLHRDKITIRANSGTGHISLSGLGEYVNEANTIIKQFDQPHFSGGQIVRYSPKHWNAGEFATVLSQSLTIEGWQATPQPTLKRPIVIYALDTSNSVFIFVKTDRQEAAQSRVQFWINEIDQPLSGGDSKSFNVYQVKNTNAELLAETVNSVLSGGSSSLVSSQTTSTQVGGATSQQNIQNRLTVDTTGNRIIFVGTQSEFSDLEGILTQLDTPAPEVLIEVLIAEVSLTDERSTGVEFFVDDIGDENFTAVAGTGGLGLGSSGLNIGFLSGNVEADINAFASNRDVKLLSKPSLVARSGGIAEIQVGQDIPVISSQRASNNQDGIGALDILQSIEYRSIGNLLAIEPIVFSDNRIDLTITQEVSSEISVANQTIPSPTISNRSISTQLSLEDGQTAVLGGLIQEDYVDDNTGVPVLKDIPVLGQLFSTKGTSVIQTDLVVLITAYVLRGQSDKNRHVNRLKTYRVDGLLDQDLNLPFVCLRGNFQSSEDPSAANCQDISDFNNALGVVN